MALNLTPSSYFHPFISHQIHFHTLSKPFFLSHSKTSTSSLSKTLLCLCASPSNTPIFLPYLRQLEPENHEQGEGIETTNKWENETKRKRKKNQNNQKIHQRWVRWLREKGRKEIWQVWSPLSVKTNILTINICWWKRKNKKNPIIISQAEL